MGIHHRNRKVGFGAWIRGRLSEDNTHTAALLLSILAMLTIVATLQLKAMGINLGQLLDEATHSAAGMVGLFSTLIPVASAITKICLPDNSRDPRSPRKDDPSN